MAFIRNVTLIFLKFSNLKVLNKQEPDVNFFQGNIYKVAQDYTACPFFNQLKVAFRNINKFIEPSAKFL
jgi:hypothetical protein